jgi:hypothetical protein
MRLAAAVCWLALGLVLAPSGASAQGTSTGTANPLPVQVIYLAHGGCQPAVAQPKPGQFLLYVVNLSREPDIQLALHSADGNTQAAQQFSTAVKSWLVRLNLATGKYTLDGANSEHHCKVDVE